MSTTGEKVKVRVFDGGSWQLVNGVVEYLPEMQKAVVLLPINLTLSGLINYLSRKLNLPDFENRFKLTYKSLSSGSVVELFDIDDARQFLAIALQILPQALRLYICESVAETNQPNSSQEIVPFTVYRPDHPQYIIPIVPFQSGEQAPSTPYQSYQNQYHPFQNPGTYETPYQSYETPYKSYENRPTYQYQDLPSDYGIRISEIPIHEYEVNVDHTENASEKYKVDLDPYHGDVSGDCLYHPNTDEFLGLQSSSSDSEPGEEDKDGTEEGVKEGSDNEDREDADRSNSSGPMGCNLFWGMPPPLPTPVPIVKAKQPDVKYQRSERVKVRQIFKCKEDLKLTLGLKCLEECHQMKTTRSTRSRFEGVCISEKCEWRIRATVIEGTKLFQVRIFKDLHTCSQTQVYPNHRQANKKVLGHILKDAMNDTSRVYKSHDIIVDMKNNFKISVSYMQAWRAKCYATLLLRGNPEESFSVLPVYCYNLEKANPGTVWKIETDEMQRFERLFVAIGCAIRSFVNHLRPLVIIDGAHLKGPYLGTMFLAVGMDGNNQILPIAYGVGKTESGESWTWFLSRLKECIGEPENLCIISDRAASINMAIRAVFPTAKHGLCCRHLEMNLRFNAKKAAALGKSFWRTCKAYTVPDFEQKLAELRQALPESARKTLDNADKTKCSRAYFDGMRYNVMTSNSAESVNALSRYARRLPIAQLIDFFRISLQQWYYDRRELGASFEQKLTPWAEAKIIKRINKSATWTAHNVTSTVFEVKDGHRNGLVDLQEWSCSCRQWQLSALPCGHVITVCRKIGMSETNFWAAKCYTTQVHRATYKEGVNPVNPPAAWEYPTEYMTVKAPLLDKSRVNRQGHQQRIPSQGEVIYEVTCSRCFQNGHNRRDCPSILPADEEAMRAARRASRSGKKSTKHQFDLNKPC